MGLLSMRDPELRAKGIDSSGPAIGCANRMAKRLERKGFALEGREGLERREGLEGWRRARRLPFVAAFRFATTPS